MTTIRTPGLAAACLCLMLACAQQHERSAGALQPASGVASEPSHAGQGASARPGSEDRLYDPATVQTVRGSITEVEYAPAMRSETLGLHVILQANAERLVVHLGPAWYMKQQAIEFEPGSSMEVTGSRLTLSGRAVILARTVSVEGKSLTLRDSAGLPVWVSSKPAEVR